MIVNHGLDNIEPSQQGRAVSIGVFDGVHLGHQKIFRRLVSEAIRKNLESTAVTFDPHPLSVLTPDRPPKHLMTLDERLTCLQEMGLNRAVVLPFDQELSGLMAWDFVERILVNALNAKAVYEGPNFSFGHGGLGDCRFLEEVGRELGFSVEVLAPALIDGEAVSSSRIRRALAAGQIDETNRCLGRPFRITGLVVRGDQRGRELGFPTANLEVDSSRALPRRGVYAVMTEVPGQAGAVPGMANIGLRPTFSGRPESFEVHLIDWNGELYGKNLAVFFIRRLRDERKFSGPAELIAQLERDRRQARPQSFTLGPNHDKIPTVFTTRGDP